MLLTSWGMRACPSHNHRQLSSNPAVSGAIPEQLSALSLLTYLYGPHLPSHQQPCKALSVLHEACLLAHQPPPSERRWCCGWRQCLYPASKASVLRRNLDTLNLSGTIPPQLSSLKELQML